MVESVGMKARWRLVLALLLSLWIGVGAALGDGGMFFPWNPRGVPEVLQPTQKVYIRWDGSQEKLLIQTRYEGPAEAMIWIVPVPSQPTVERGDAAIFDELHAETVSPALSYTEFATLQVFGPTSSLGRSGGSSEVEWRRRVGDYDVVLLRPTGAENVLQWLNSNEFAVPGEIAPVLEDYIREGWWMVASRIHPDALTDITRDKLADGTLHPLEFAFESSACVYPMRLTRMAAGPVEELIYIEGPRHYEPVTFADDQWAISLSGGPIRQVRDGTFLSDVEYVTEIVEGRATTAQTRCVTRLHRVFQPEEMVDDLFFDNLDYAKWLASGDRLRAAQAATQYGRRRDPNGIPHLVAALSPDALDQVNPAPEDYHQSFPPSARVLSQEGLGQWLYYWAEPWPPEGDEPYILLGCVDLSSCIWALGEIASEHEVDQSVEDTLVRCAECDNQLVRMEAYLALTKLGSEKIGSILRDRVTDVLIDSPVPANFWGWEMRAAVSEMEIVTDWILHFGTTQEKDLLVDALARQIEGIPRGEYFANSPERQRSQPADWTEWVVWRAACSQDARLVAPLQELHARIVDEDHPTWPAITRVEAACGSPEATTALVQQIIGLEADILKIDQAEGTGGIASLQNLYYTYNRPASLRVQIIEDREWRYKFYPMPPEAGDALVRTVLSEEGLSDWYTLYLLAQIKKPLAQDQEQLLQIWSKGDQTMTLVAADVLYAWGDEDILLDWYDKTDLPEVRSEVAWALAELEARQAADVIEQQVHESWNGLWASLKQLFFLRPSSRSGSVSPDDPVTVDAVRKAEALWRYFHPALGTLDDVRLASLKRLAADTTIHPGVKVELLSSDYGTTGWGKPLLEAAVMEVLEIDPSTGTVAKLVSRTSNEFVVDLCDRMSSDEFLRTLLNNLLTGLRGSNQGVVEGLLWEVWPKRYVESEGQSLLFREPGNLDFDRYDLNDSYGPSVADALEAIVRDESMPAGYRAFLIIHWRRAPLRIPIDLLEALLEGDMPDFLHEALEQRLPEWQ